MAWTQAARRPREEVLQLSLRLVHRVIDQHEDIAETVKSLATRRPRLIGGYPQWPLAAHEAIKLLKAVPDAVDEPVALSLLVGE